uniref:Uncharacterized protein n=1 Tax=Panagrolaimus sp. JU765 TaxID=591449 RepID=A0AC34QD30_9BILA
MTLTEAVEKDLIDSSHCFVDRGTRSRFTLLEAIANGLIDAETQHIVDPDEKDVVSITEALERGLINSIGKFNLQKEQKTLNLNEAIREGLLTKRVRHTIFDVKGIKNTKTGLNLSFNEAIEAGVLNVSSERITDLNTNQSSSISDASERIIDPMLKELLVSSSGFKDGNYELSLIRAVAKGIIDPIKGIIIDHQREITPSEAYNSGIVSLRGAIKLSGLLNVHPSLMTPIKKSERKKRIQRPGQATKIGDDQIKVTLAEAMKQGLIDSRTQRFKQGNTEMSLHEALNQGLIDPSSEWIIPNRNSQIGPTIEEKTEEKITETGQQLAPKIYPDKQYEETINTVKRVKRTETSAIGGPGGVSIYRAITGGKNSIEIPNDGYHLREAERKGLIDLSTGLIIPPGIDKQLTLEEALQLGIINGKSFNVKDPKSGRQLTPLEAIEQKIMDKNGKIDNRGRKLTLQEAIDEKIVHLEYESPAHLTDSNKKLIQFKLLVSSSGFKDGNYELSLIRAVAKGIIDPIKGIIIDHQREITPSEAYNNGIVSLRGAIKLSGLLNVHPSLMTPIKKSERKKRIQRPGQATKIETINTVKRVKRTETSAIGGPGGVSIYRAITGGKNSIEIPNDGYHLREAERKGLIDLSTGLIIPPGIDKQLTLEEALQLGIINGKSFNVKDPKSGRQLTPLEAIEQKIMDKNGKIDQRGRKLTLQEAIDEKVVHLEYESPAHLTETNKKLIQFSQGTGPVMSFKPVGQAVIEEHEQSWSFDSTVGQLIDTSTGERLTIDSAIRNGRLSIDDLRVRDALTGREMTFDEAEKWGIIDVKNGYYLDKSMNQRMSFTDAARQHRIYPTGGVPENAGDAIHTTVKIQTRSQVSKKEAVNTDIGQLGEYNIGKMITSNAYDPNSGKFKHPEAEKDMTLKELI